MSLPRHTEQLLTQYYYMYTCTRSVGGGGGEGVREESTHTSNGAGLQVGKGN